MNPDDKYNFVIGKLREHKPALGDSQELTNRIMASIRKEKKLSASVVLIKMRPWLTAAAIFLAGLFVFQNTGEPIQETNTKPVATVKTTPGLNDCFAEFTKGKTDRAALLRGLLCYQKQSEQKSKSAEQLIMEYRNKF